MFDLDASPLAAPARLLGLTALLSLTATLARAQETAVVSLKDAVKTEVQERTFTLPKDMKVHVYAKGGGAGHQPFFAYGWILNAATREVVWQMDGHNAKAEGDFQVADQYLDLKAGTYEAYYSNHGFGWGGGFSHGVRNIDRRRVEAKRDPKDREEHWFRDTFEALIPGRIEDWQARAPYYGMELYVKPAEAAEVKTAAGPQAWKNEVLSLLATKDDGEWHSGFKVTRPITLHVYCQGERVSRGEMSDTGWIMEARTHKVVWEMSDAKASFAGGAEKNRRQVETLLLPPGEYLVGYTTDDSHSPADWNAAPPCDPLRYGLILSVPKDAELSAFSVQPAKEPGKVLASVVKVGNDRHEKASFTLGAASSVRVYAIGEADDDEMADVAWITDASGAKVWTMTVKGSTHAGGARKNRMQDQVIGLPAGTYTLHFETDGTHAYGDWNDLPPRDSDHYGATVYAE
jgi:hypothetical protein